jgi:cyclopropane fatty-acyl-phospholipid synthase-like methyltransferase
MIEAVGHEHLASYFATISAALKPGGKAVIQVRLDSGAAAALVAARSRDRPAALKETRLYSAVGCSRYTELAGQLGQLR